MSTYLKYLLILIAILPLPFSCNDTEDPDLWQCPDTRYDLHAFDELQINDLKLSTSDTLTTDHLKLSLYFLVMQSHTVSENTPRSGSFTFFPSAFALSCVGPHVKETLAITQISSTGDFSEAYPAGSDLSALFVSEFNEKELDQLFIQVVGYNEPNMVVRGVTTIELTEKPTTEPVHQFTIKFAVSSGATYSVTTAPIQFL